MDDNFSQHTALSEMVNKNFTGDQEQANKLIEMEGCV